MSKKKNPNTIKPTKGDRILDFFIIVILIGIFRSLTRYRNRLDLRLFVRDNITM